MVALHDVWLASRYCDRLTLISDGQVVAEGTPAEVFTLQRFREVFGVEAVVEHESDTGMPHVRLMGPTPARSER